MIHTFTYTAKTSGFSPSAITGKTTTKEAVNVTMSKPNIGSLENNVSNATNEQTHGQAQSSSTSNNGSKKSPDFEAVVGIICLLAVFLYKRN